MAGRKGSSSRDLTYVLDAVARVVRRVLLSVSGRLRRRDVRGDVPVVVSVTTFGVRLQSVHLCLESIARGTRRPVRLVLWLDDDLREQPLPPGLSRLVRRGLDVQYTHDWRSHKKYYPFVLEDAGLPLVIADDDVFYPKSWLETLWSQAEAHPDCVVAHRAHRFSFTSSGEVEAYSSWPAATGEPSFATFATGVGGVAYPVQLLDHLREDGQAFQDMAPSADDVWLHSRAVRNGFRTKQVADAPLVLKMIPGTQATSLNAHNLKAADGIAPNDAQIAVCYGPDDLERIRLDVKGARL